MIFEKRQSAIFFGFQITPDHRCIIEKYLDGFTEIIKGDDEVSANIKKAFKQHNTLKHILKDNDLDSHIYSYMGYIHRVIAVIAKNCDCVPMSESFGYESQTGGFFLGNEENANTALAQLKSVLADIWFSKIKGADPIEEYSEMGAPFETIRDFW